MHTSGYDTWTLLTATGFFTTLDWALSALVGVGIVAMLGIKTRGRLARLKSAACTAGQ